MSRKSAIRKKKAINWKEPDLGWHVLKARFSVLGDMIRDHEWQIISSAWDVEVHKLLRQLQPMKV
jgi:hypothetical protein